jgi:hypothetical protein
MENEIHGTNFVADGPAAEGSPNVGFVTSEQGSFGIGVDGIATAMSWPPAPLDAIGVRGRIVSADGGPGPGVGVRGLSVEGMGVQGLNEGDGIGVQGQSGGIGVQGQSDGIGVQGQSETGTGVSGISNFIGVQGEGGSIGVLGGGAASVLTTQPSYVGVAGTGPTDPSTFTFSYGGWFSRGAGIQGGTAPLHLEPAGPDDPKPPAAAQMGDLFVDSADTGGTVRLYFCTHTGDNNPTPATWRPVLLGPPVA